jgi:hypothetical protein
MTKTNLELEEEFFAVEGRPQPGGNRACTYVAGLEATPSGDSITAEERAALWYLAYWSHEAVASTSVGALSMHLDLGSRTTRSILRSLVEKGVLRWRVPIVDRLEADVQVYEFAELRG